MNPETSRSGFENVREAAAIYDTLVVSPVWYGSEAKVKGWYEDFPAMAAQERHIFFKDRTEASASLAYCNKQSADVLDFAFKATSIGVAFIAPGVRAIGDRSAGTGEEFNWATQVGHFFETVLPRHCSMEFKIQQDVVLELPCMAASPGYGPVGSGAAFQHQVVGLDEVAVPPNPDYMPVMNMSVTQGVPRLDNRFSFPTVKDIPRTATIEVTVKLSEIARNYLANLPGDWYYKLGGDPLRPRAINGYNNYNEMPARFLIQVSLFGTRLVQQRAQYHR